MQSIPGALGQGRWERGVNRRCVVVRRDEIWNRGRVSNDPSSKETAKEADTAGWANGANAAARDFYELSSLADASALTLFRNSQRRLGLIGRQVIGVERARFFVFEERPIVCRRLVFSRRFVRWSFAAALRRSGAVIGRACRRLAHRRFRLGSDDFFIDFNRAWTSPASRKAPPARGMVAVITAIGVTDPSFRPFAQRPGAWVPDHRASRRRSAKP